MPGGICPWGKCPGDTCHVGGGWGVGYVLEPRHIVHKILTTFAYST